MEPHGEATHFQPEPNAPSLFRDLPPILPSKLLLGHVWFVYGMAELERPINNFTSISTLTVFGDARYDSPAFKQECVDNR